MSRHLAPGRQRGEYAACSPYLCGGQTPQGSTADGVISGGPDGTGIFNPWSALADVRADTAFLLLGHDGKVLCFFPFLRVCASSDPRYSA